MLPPEENQKSSFSGQKSPQKKSENESNKSKGKKTIERLFRQTKQNFGKSDRDKQYTLYVMSLLCQVSNNFQGIEKNKVANFSAIIKSESINESIRQSLVKAFSQTIIKAKERNICDQNKSSVYDLWFQNQIQVVQRHTIPEILGLLNSLIQQNSKQIQSQFDLVLTANKTSYLQSDINKFFMDQEQNSSSKKVWIIQDYLHVQKLVKNQYNCFQDTQCKYVFELKSNPFGKREQDKINITGWVEKNNLQDFIKPLKTLIRNNNKQRIRDIMEKGTFKQKFFLRLFQKNMESNVSQIIRQIYAAIHQYFICEKSKIQFTQYLEKRNLNQSSVKIQFKLKNHPMIIFYYIINSNVSKQEFKQAFDFFRPLLKHLFIYFKAVFHVVGITQLNKEQGKNSILDILKKQTNQEQEQKRLKMQVFQKQMEEQRKKMEQQIKRQLEEQRKKMEQQIKRQLEEQRKQIYEQRKQIQEQRKQIDEQRKQMEQHTKRSFYSKWKAFL